MLKFFSKTPPENSGGAENSTETSGTNGINFFCYMYESSLQHPHPVWVPEINVKPCNSVTAFWGTIIVSRGHTRPRKLEFKQKEHQTAITIYQTGWTALPLITYQGFFSRGEKPSDDINILLCLMNDICSNVSFS